MRASRLLLAAAPLAGQMDKTVTDAGMPFHPKTRAWHGSRTRRDEAARVLAWFQNYLR